MLLFTRTEVADVNPITFLRRKHLMPASLHFNKADQQELPLNDRPCSSRRSHAPTQRPAMMRTTSLKQIIHHVTLPTRNACYLPIYVLINKAHQQQPHYSRSCLLSAVRHQLHARPCCVQRHRFLDDPKQSPLQQGVPRNNNNTDSLNDRSCHRYFRNYTLAHRRPLLVCTLSLQ